MKRIASIALSMIFVSGSFAYANEVKKEPVKKHAHEKSHKHGKRKEGKHKTTHKGTTHKNTVTHDPTVKYSDKEIKNSF